MARSPSGKYGRYADNAKGRAMQKRDEKLRLMRKTAAYRLGVKDGVKIGTSQALAAITMGAFMLGDLVGKTKKKPETKEEECNPTTTLTNTIQ